MPNAAVGTCRPWCADHVDATPRGRQADPADQLCQRIRTSPAYGEILMTHSAGQGTTIALYNTREELTPAEAEQLAHALLQEVAAARAASSGCPSPGQHVGAPGPAHKLGEC
ncbi:hypothetical protein ACIBP6_29825 [Nonomuraea terrae]|uniref:hypothetical protein n=1 Tax=Nonomuraea terrae TaxID=2530383 RepID=UPI0037A46A77